MQLMWVPSYSHTRTEKQSGTNTNMCISAKLEKAVFTDGCNTLLKFLIISRLWAKLKITLLKKTVTIYVLDQAGFIWEGTESCFHFYLFFNSIKHSRTCNFLPTWTKQPTKTLTVFPALLFITTLISNLQLKHKTICLVRFTNIIACMFSWIYP